MGSPQVAPLLRALGLLFTIRGLANPPRALLQRTLGFRALAGVELGSTAMYGVVGVVLGITGFGVWALVVAQIVSEVVTAALVWWAVDFRPRLRDFDWQLARQLGGFGRHMVAASMLGMLHLQLPTILVGKLLGTEILGFYWVAFRWAQLPIQGLTYVASRVAYPVYARLRQEPGRFAEGYLRVLQTIILLAMPTSIGLALVAEPLIATLYDARWVTSVRPLRILAFYGLFAAVGSTTGEVFKGAGVPRYVTAYAVLYNVLLGAGLAIFGWTHGLQGIALATVIAPLGVALVALHRVTVLLDIRMRSITELLVAPSQGTIVMVIAVLATSRLLSLVHAGPLLRLVVEATVGALAYGAVLYRLEPAWVREALATLGVRWSGAARVDSAERVERDVASREA
jgi:PST family polysaccharide transporter